MAFNVAVECDRPRDKYYYISRGIELLGEGERRNQGSGDDLVAQTAKKMQFPGNPELRYYMGFFLQLKIGSSDEKNTMRSLFEMSGIDPVKREPSQFEIVQERGQRAIQLEKFLHFCQDHPRMVRRLREKLGLDTPQQIVKFLRDNRNVPSRFKRTVVKDQQESELEEPRRQWPLLPPALDRDWPDARKLDYALDNEVMDEYVAARSWYQYAQKPLPDLTQKQYRNVYPGLDEIDYDRTRYRIPKAMVTQIFRSYPSRAQGFAADNRQQEGWFDSDGWLIRDWFDRLPGQDGNEIRVGTDSKYHSRSAWDKAFRLQAQFGEENNLYLSPEKIAEFEGKAELSRKKFRIGKSALAQSPDLSDPAVDESYRAHQILYWNGSYRTMLNFDVHYYQAMGERLPQMVYGRKLIHQAERYRRFEAAPDLALMAYEEGLPFLLQGALATPKFGTAAAVMEELVEQDLKFVKLMRDQRADVLRPVMVGLAQMATWPHPAFEEWGWISPADRARIAQYRFGRSPLELVQIYQPENEPMPLDALQYVLLPSLQQMATSFRGAGFVPLAVSPGPYLMHNLSQYSGQHDYFMMRMGSRGYLPGPGWIPLVSFDSIRTIRDRLGMAPLPDEIAK